MKSLDPATLTVTVKNKARTGAIWTLTFHPRATDTVVRVSGRPGGFAVAKDTPATLRNAFEKATTPPTPAPTKKP